MQFSMGKKNPKLRKTIKTFQPLVLWENSEFLLFPDKVHQPQIVETKLSKLFTFPDKENKSEQF